MEDKEWRGEYYSGIFWGNITVEYLGGIPEENIRREYWREILEGNIRGEYKFHYYPIVFLHCLWLHIPHLLTESATSLLGSWLTGVIEYIPQKEQRKPSHVKYNNT